MHETSRAEGLAGTLEDIARLLPAQGPIGVFIHHNPLHAFEDRPFEQAVVEAGAELGCEPFLPEAHYRSELSRGRIAKRDVSAVLRESLGPHGDVELAPGVTRFELRRRLCLRGIVAAREPALGWILSETTALERFRPDLHDEIGRLSVALGEASSGDRAGAREREAVEALWRACLAAIDRAPARADREPELPARPRDLLLRVRGLDTDLWVHPLLIRFCSAFLDQGLSHWVLPGRDLGLYDCFLDLYGSRSLRQGEAWARRLPDLVAEERRRGHSALESLAASLDALGVEPEKRRAFLSETALALRGWAGIVRQIEVRPDRVPVQAVPARLADFLAVRLLLERTALDYAASREGRRDGSLATWLAQVGAELAPPMAPTREERAWPLFHACQLCSLDAAAVTALHANQVGALERELCDFDGLARRGILHLAYERRLRHRFYDALARPPAVVARVAPPFQAMFCIDEREESMRRHLEEVAPDVETFGAAGFYGVAMYFQGEHDVHPRPLCPVAITPRHYVRESPPVPAQGVRPWRQPWQEWRDHREREWVLARHFGSRSLVRGAVLMPILGAISIVPLVLRVLFPGLGRQLSALGPRAGGERATVLHLDREPYPPPLGEHSGFTVDEMSEIVRNLCENAGLTGRASPLVLIVAHGSTSLNNPHESAHDCGACGGGRGGPNARSVARMANDPRVREHLGATGAPIDPGTWFVGAERNTCDNGVTFFDTDAVPSSHRALLERARDALTEAARREAHERCRRFEHARLDMSPDEALAHVQLRANDLAQPRPEYGHATNALCVVGRRARTRGLFLDRRAFLVSYDPDRDPEGRVLERLLGAVLPVVGGISLEYLFGYVDPTGFGCGTKLPHNVAGFLGVMDGAQSDLRTGLPWQMLEIHEPVRLSIVVECPLERLERWLATHEDLASWVRNGWIFLACLDPESDTLQEMTPAGPRRFAREEDLPSVIGTSADIYRGKREHLRIARIEAEAVDGAES